MENAARTERAMSDLLRRASIYLALSVAVLAIGASLSPANARGGKQTIEGTIVAPARHPDGCYTGLSRHLWSLIGDGSSGLVGYTFDVDKSTWNKPFVLEAGGGAGIVDLDLSYYLSEFASQAEFLNNPAPASPATIEFETHTGPGEKGRVPKFAVKAIVCIYAGEAGSSAAVPFTYTAGK